MGCDIFEKEEEKEDVQELENTLGQENSSFDLIGQYNEYFFKLDKKLDITYEASALQVTEGSPNIIDQQITFKTIPEYLLYLTPDDAGYSDSLYNTDLFEFEEFESSSILTSDLRSKIVKPHSGIAHVDSIVWVDGKYEYRSRDLGNDDLDDNPNINENEDIEFISELVGGESNAYLDISGTNFMIWTDDQIFGNKEIRIIDAISNPLVFLDLSELDTSVVMTQALDAVGMDKFFEHTTIFTFDRALHIDSILYELTNSEELESVLFDQNGDTIFSFLPDQTYTLEDGTEITPIQTSVYLDTVYKSFIDYESFDTLITNDIIDSLNSSENVYSVAKTITESPLESTTDYFLYREGISASGNNAILELMYPAFFDYYGGIYEPPTGSDPGYYDDNGWSYSSLNQDSVYFYLPFRAGEIVENEWTSTFDDDLNGNSAVYDIYTKNVVESDSITIPVFPIEGTSPEFTFSNDSLNYIFSDVFKVTKSSEMTMYGTAVTYYEDQIYWLVKGLGIVKQQLWYHWGEGFSYPPVLGYEWTMSSYSEVEVENSVGAIFTSLDDFAQAMGMDKFKVKRSAGLKKMEPVQ